MILALEQILRRPRVVLAFMAMMLVAGVYSYLTIPKEARPDIQVPVFYVSIPLQGVSPEDAERLLVKPMEEELRALEGLKELTDDLVARATRRSWLNSMLTSTPTRPVAMCAKRSTSPRAELPSRRRRADRGQRDQSEPVSDHHRRRCPAMCPSARCISHARAASGRAWRAIPSVLEARLSGQREELLEVHHRRC